ncbi:MAG TPA: pilus assembly protein TadG-related protein [Paracoccaceae bacterium]|nr:pilus assembly protein TadG-related protein [Paracoccaceae bacterium]
MFGSGMSGLTEATALRANARQRLSRFWRAEDGTLIIYSLFMFVCMLYLAGVALDLMRFEERRTVLQATIDRAVLAAADMDQTLDCKAVIRDWFVKAGEAAPADSDISCTKDEFGSEVSVNANANMQTWFMNLYGIDIPTLATASAGSAEEKIGSVEISLVLDVSGSMNSNSRLTYLKPAAKSFIDKMFDNVETGKLSMSVVTYSTQVALGPDLIKYFDHTAEHTSSACLEFDSGDFANTTMEPKSTPVGSPPAVSDRKYQLNGHFDPFNTTLVNTSSNNTLLNCPPNSATNRNIMAFSGNRSDLKSKIDSLVASGNTSIDLGTKWGAALLDPSMRPVADAMITEGLVSSNFSGRPYSYTNPDGSKNTEVLKVLVIMTDGENTTEYKLKPAFDQDPSRLHYNNTSNSAYNGSSYYKRYSLYDSTRSSNKYFSFYTNTWRSEPWGTQATDISGTDTTVQLTWPEVWATMSVNWFADNLIFRAYGSTTRNSWRTSASNAVATSKIYSSKDSLTLNVCSAAKAKGVLVFTIGYEAPTAGQALLSNCASSTAHYYPASGPSIGNTFDKIANSINKLRLTH